MLKAFMEALKAKERAASLAQPEPVTEPLTIPMPTYRLALPAPVVDPLLLELDALAAKLARAEQLVEIPIQKSKAA